MSLKLNSSGGGSVTLQEPVTASTLTLTLPAFSGTAATLASVTNNGVLFVNSSGQPTSGSALTFDGTTFNVDSGATALNSNFNSTNANGVFLRFQNSGTSIGDLGSGANLFSGGTAGDFGLTSRAGNLVFGTSSVERMRLTSTGLGIGTSSPGARLDVVTTGQALKLSTAANQTHIEFRDTTNSKSGFLNYTNDSLIYFRNGPVQVFNFDSSGNLGLGVTPSAWATLTAMQVKNGSLYGYSTSEVGLTGNAYYNAGWKYIATGAATKYSQGESGLNNHAWFTAPSGTAGNAISFTQAMTLDASGNLGIGTTSFNERLRINGDSNATSRIRIQNQGTDIAYFGSALGILGSGNANDLMLSSVSTNNLLFGTNNAERARINSAGNLMVGTTSDQAGGLASFIKVGGASNPGFIVSKGGINVGYLWFYDLGDTLRLETNNQDGTNNSISCVAGSGGVQLSYGGTSWSSLSDERLKTGLVPIESAVSKVAAIRAVTGRFKTDEDTVSRAFLIAQDVQAVLPEAITTIKQKDDDTEYLGLQYTDTIPLLVAAIQEQQAMIAQLQADIASLKGTA